MEDPLTDQHDGLQTEDAQQYNRGGQRICFPMFSCLFGDYRPKGRDVKTTTFHGAVKGVPHKNKSQFKGPHQCL